MLFRGRCCSCVCAVDPCVSAWTENTLQQLSEHQLLERVFGSFVNCSVHSYIRLRSSRQTSQGYTGQQRSRARPETDNETKERNCERASIVPVRERASTGEIIGIGPCAVNSLRCAVERYGAVYV